MRRFAIYHSTGEPVSIPGLTNALVISAESRDVIRYRLRDLGVGMVGVKVVEVDADGRRVEAA